MNENMTKEDRIKKEIARLNKLYKNIDKDKKAAIDGLIRRAAFMRITLEEYEDDLLTNGYTEKFSQSEKMDPYDRERPVARLYSTMNKNYQTIMRLLSDALPDGDKKENDDALLQFIAK